MTPSVLPFQFSPPTPAASNTPTASDAEVAAPTGPHASTSFATLVEAERRKTEPDVVTDGSEAANLGFPASADLTLQTVENPPATSDAAAAGEPTETGSESGSIPQAADRPLTSSAPRAPGLPATLGWLPLIAPAGEAGAEPAMAALPDGFVPELDHGLAATAGEASGARAAAAAARRMSAADIPAPVPSQAASQTGIQPGQTPAAAAFVVDGFGQSDSLASEAQSPHTSYAGAAPGGGNALESGTASERITAGLVSQSAEAAAPAIEPAAPLPAWANSNPQPAGTHAALPLTSPDAGVVRLDGSVLVESLHSEGASPETEAASAAAATPVGSAAKAGERPLAVTPAAASAFETAPPATDASAPTTGPGAASRQGAVPLTLQLPAAVEASAAPVPADLSTAVLPGQESRAGAGNKNLDEVMLTQTRTLQALAAAMLAHPGGDPTRAMLTAAAASTSPSVLPPPLSGVAPGVSQALDVAALGATQEQIATGLANLVRGGSHVAEIQLEPPELGRVRLRLEVRDHTVTGTIEVEKSGVLTALQADMRSLVSALEKVGIQCERLDVHLLDPRRGQERRESRRPGRQNRDAPAEETELAAPTPPRPRAGRGLVDYWF